MNEDIASGTFILCCNLHLLTYIQSFKLIIQLVDDHMLIEEIKVEFKGNTMSIQNKLHENACFTWCHTTKTYCLMKNAEEWDIRAAAKRVPPSGSPILRVY